LLAIYHVNLHLKQAKSVYILYQGKVGVLCYK